MYTCFDYVKPPLCYNAWRYNIEGVWTAAYTVSQSTTLRDWSKKALTPIAQKEEILWLSRLSQTNIRSNSVDINENSELREKQGIDQVTWINTNTNF